MGDSLNEQLSAPNSGRKPRSRACGCRLEPQGQAAWHSSLPCCCTHHPLPSGGVAAPQILLGALLGLRCPQNCGSGTIWKSIIWPGQTHARACSKLNIMDDGMPERNPVPWSDLVYQRNLTGETRGSTGNVIWIPCVLWFRCGTYTFMASSIRCAGKPVVNHTKLLLFSVFFILNKNFFYGKMLLFFGHSHWKSSEWLFSWK